MNNWVDEVNADIAKEAEALKASSPPCTYNLSKATARFFIGGGWYRHEIDGAITLSLLNERGVYRVRVFAGLYFPEDYEFTSLKEAKTFCKAVIIGREAGK